MLELNDEGEAEKKALALTLRATQIMGRLNLNQMMTSMNS